MCQAPNQEFYCDSSTPTRQEKIHFPVATTTQMTGNVLLASILHFFQVSNSEVETMWITNAPFASDTLSSNALVRCVWRGFFMSNTARCGQGHASVATR